MKDIKSYVIGFLTCCCLFLIMGQTRAEKDVSVVMEDIKTLLTENGRYQATSVDSVPQPGLIFTTIIDTRTGEIVQKTKTKKSKYNKI